MPAVIILLITVSAHLVGTAVLFGITIGRPEAILLAPLLAIFGWFFVFPELIGVIIQWRAYKPSGGKKSFLKVMLATVFVASLLMGLVGPKEEGHLMLWTSAYVIATAAAASWSMCLVAVAKRVVW